MSRRVIVVFGGSGFVGRHLVRQLAKEDAIIRVAVRDPDAALFLKTAGEIGQIVPIQANVTHPRSVEAAIRGADGVVNLVGILSEWGRRTFQRVHVEGAANVARAAAAAGASRLVQMSAIGADPDSDSAYARTKAAGEQAAREAFPDATVVRPSVVFGPEDKFFNLFAGLARMMPVLPVFGGSPLPRLPRSADFVIDLCRNGGTRFQPVYVSDVALAISKALIAPAAKGQSYDLGGPKIYSFKEIMALILTETRRRRILMPIPFFAASINAWFLEKMPNPLLTRDQVRLLRRDNVVPEGALDLKDLGIEPTPVESVVPDYLRRFRPPTRQGRRNRAQP